jgi:hypothetical protein
VKWLKWLVSGSLLAVLASVVMAWRAGLVAKHAKKAGKAVEKAEQLQRQNNLNDATRELNRAAAHQQSAAEIREKALEQMEKAANENPELGDLIVLFNKRVRDRRTRGKPVG